MNAKLCCKMECSHQDSMGCRKQKLIPGSLGKWEFIMWTERREWF